MKVFFSIVLIVVIILGAMFVVNNISREEQTRLTLEGLSEETEYKVFGHTVATEEETTDYLDAAKGWIETTFGE